MSRVIHTGSDAILHSRDQIEQRLLAKAKANTQPLIGTELELFVTTPDHKPITFAQVQQLFEKLAASFKGVRKLTEQDHIVGLQIKDVGDVCLEPGGQVELSTKPCRDLQELESVNRSMREALDTTAAALGLTVKGEGYNPTFMNAEDMPRSRFRAYYRYCHHEIGRAAEDLIKTMKSSASLQVNVDPLGDKFHEIYRALLLVDVGNAFNAASGRQARLAQTYDPYFSEQTEPLFAALKVRSNEELVRLVVDRLLTIRVPFVPDRSPEGFKSTIDVFGNPPTVGALLEKGLLTEELLDNTLSLQLSLPNFRRDGVLETRAHDSVNTAEDLMATARAIRNAAYNEAARTDLLKRFKDVDPDLLRAAFAARGTLPKDKLMSLGIGGGLTVGDLAAPALAEKRRDSIGGVSSGQALRAHVTAAPPSPRRPPPARRRP